MCYVMPFHGCNRRTRNTTGSKGTMNVYLLPQLADPTDSRSSVPIQAAHGHALTL